MLIKGRHLLLVLVVFYYNPAYDLPNYLFRHDLELKRIRVQICGKG